MIKRLNTAVIAAALALAVAVPASAQIEIRPDTADILSARMTGEWIADSALTAKLGWNVPTTTAMVRADQPVTTVTFKPDTTVVTRIPATWVTEHQGVRVYVAGYLTLVNQQHPFLLIRRDDDDDPTVIYFMDQPTDPMKATQSLRLTLIPGKAQENDLLFIRNMENNQIVAYKRAGPN